MPVIGPEIEYNEYRVSLRMSRVETEGPYGVSRVSGIARECPGSRVDMRWALVERREPKVERRESIVEYGEDLLVFECALLK